MKTRWLAGLILLGLGGVLAIGLAFWFSRPAIYQGIRLDLAQFTEREVTAQIWIEKDTASLTWLAASFTPTRPKFHLYSKDLSPDGLQGMGRPTRLEVVIADQMTVTGPLTADPAPIEDYVPALDITFPVYPDGTVTLRLPVELAEGNETVTAELSVTYMACGGGKCLPPVIDKRVPVSIPLAKLHP